MTARHAVALGPATVDQVTKSYVDVAAILPGRDLISLNPLPFPGVATGLGHGGECGSDGPLMPQTPQNVPG